MQLVRSEPLSEDTLSLVATDSGDSGVVHLGYNLICLWNQVSSVGSHSCHVKQVMEGSQRDEALHDSRVNINSRYQIAWEAYSIKAPPVWSHRAPMKRREKSPTNTPHHGSDLARVHLPRQDSYPGLVSNIFLLFGFRGNRSPWTWITGAADRNRGSIYGPNWRATCD